MNNEQTKTRANFTYLGKLMQSNERREAEAWYRQHRAALLTPREGPETSIGILLKGWLLYTDTHAAHYESGIGQDGVLGVHWAAIGHALRGLLNGETGRLDCGLLDGVIAGTLEAEECAGE